MNHVLGKLPGDREELFEPGRRAPVDAGQDVLEAGVKIERPNQVWSSDIT